MGARAAGVKAGEAGQLGSVRASARMDLTNLTAWVTVTDVPSIFRELGFSGVLYFNDHGPVHVHMIKGDTECVVEIAPDGSVSVLKVSRHMKDQEVALALAIAEAHADLILATWRTYHGQ